MLFLVRLHQLEYVLAVAEERSFTRAAARLHLAQPSLSRQIRLLERELGVLLFNRGRGQALVTPTSDGDALLPFMRRVLADVEATGAEARALRGMAQGRLSIGATPSLITRVLAPALVEFHGTHPGIELMVVEAGSRQLVPLLASGEVDLALVVLPVTDPLVHTTALFDDPLVLAVAPGHPLARRRRVGVGDLDGLPLVMFREGYDLRSVTLAACSAVGAEPHLVSQGGEMDGVLAFVAAGLGAAVVPAIALPSETGPTPQGGAAPRPGVPFDPDVVAIPFSPPGIRRTVALAQRNDRPLARPARALADQLSAGNAGNRPTADPPRASGV
jgi:DNA-binding transcriptional LysR family regulator